jgi:hypothetical protein
MGLLGVSTIAVSANAQTARHCHIREGEGGVLINADTHAPFGYKDACIELNPHVGGNAATAEQARKAVSDFLQALFNDHFAAHFTSCRPCAGHPRSLR